MEQREGTYGQNGERRRSGGQRRCELRKAGTCRAECVSVLCGKYSSTSRKVLSGTAGDGISNLGWRMLPVPVVSCQSFRASFRRRSFRRICNPPHINIRVCDPEKTNSSLFSAACFRVGGLYNRKKLLRIINPHI